MSSLRGRLVLTLLAALLLGGGLAAAGLYWRSIEEFDKLFDQRLLALSFNLTAEAVLQSPQPLDPAESRDDIVVQVWRPGGVMLWHSDEETAPFPSVIGMTDLVADGQQWRSFSRVVEKGMILQVSQDLDARREEAAEAALQLLLPLLLLLPLVGLVCGWAVSRQLRPLRLLAAQMQARKLTDTLRVTLADAPSELAPVVTALNGLLERQAEASQRQRDFLADAAHELRTPLAVVQLQAQRVREALCAEDRQQSLDALQAGIERASRLISQLLSLARSEAPSAVTAQTNIALAALVQEVLAERHSLAVERELDLGITDAKACFIKGDRESLRSLVGNLVDNAIRYIPAGGRIDVALRRERGWAVLTVTDTGPGIAPLMREQLFRRFVRGGISDTAGTGLGLAIARQVAECHGGDIALEDGDAGQGLCVRVRLPLVG
ncbi:MAG: HAMP domain-containing sensor histidine kinase [Pseudomonadota bacterium]